MKGISGLNDLNRTIFNTLATDEWLKTHNVNVYSDVNKDNTFPYIVLGENAPDNTQGSTYWNETQIITLHVYTQTTKSKALDILDRVSFLCHEKFDLPHHIIEYSGVWKSPIVFDDLDQFTKHGVVQMKYKIKNKVLYREE